MMSDETTWEAEGEKEGREDDGRHGVLAWQKPARPIHGTLHTMRVGDLDFVR
jgi:hypothetical protein